MKSFLVIASSILLCSCADMYVTKTDVATPCGSAAAPIDTKDFGSSVGVRMINCGVGASNPRAIYIRPFCIDTAVFKATWRRATAKCPFARRLLRLSSRKI